MGRGKFSRATSCKPAERSLELQNRGFRSPSDTLFRLTGESRAIATQLTLFQGIRIMLSIMNACFLLAKAID